MRRDSRQRILALLKSKGPLSAAAVARQLRMTGAGARQHLGLLQAHGLVTAQEERRPRGRPAKMWSATEAASGGFADGHATLSLGLLEGVARRWGRRSLVALLRPLAQAQLARAVENVGATASPLAKLRAVARQRRDEGYLTETRTARNGESDLIECHCVIGKAARAHPDICAAELQALRSLLGREVTVARIAHLASGDPRCVYRVRSRVPRRKPR